MDIKRLIKRVLYKYKGLHAFYIKKKSRFVNSRYRNKPRKEIFETIYRSKSWGGKNGYYSGEGSHIERLIAPYAELIKQFIVENGIKTVLDCGCGDFHVAQLWLEDTVDYIGVDIFQGLIESHNKQYASGNKHFQLIDIVADELPDAELCLIRQVLQHLCNEDIMKVIRKLDKYDYVIITEHRTVKEETSIYNTDILTGSSTRVSLQSGLYLEEEPFNTYNEVLLSIPYESNNPWHEELVSVLIKPKSLLVGK